MKFSSNSIRRFLIYIAGLFLLALGVTFSIIANIGVSPVTAFPYALSLITSLTVGTMTVIANLLFITLQAIILKKISLKEFFVQLIVVTIFGFFIDLTIWLTGGLPAANSIWLISVYSVLSLLIVPFGLMLYFTATLPMMPYDMLTKVVATKWQLVFGKAKMMCDLSVVCLSLVVCLISIHSFGSIGLGTVIAAYGLGKILSIIMPKLQPSIQAWVFQEQKTHVTRSD